MDFNRNHFDLIRLFAATQVAIVHGLNHFGLEEWWAVSHVLRLFPGVPIFFVLSGFLVSASLVRSSDLNSYFTKRALRIFPALWVALFACVIMVYIVDGLDASATTLSLWLVAQTTVFQFYNPAFLRDFGIGVLNGSLWTIPVEIQFYACLPLLYLLLRRLRWSVAPVLALLVVLLLARQLNIELFRDFDELGAKLYGVSLLPHLYLFMLGVLIQHRFDAIVPWLARHALVLLGSYVLLAVVLGTLGFEIYGNAINSASATLLAFVVIGIGYWRVPAPPILRHVDISYGTYIYHMPVVNLMLEFDAPRSLGSLFAMLATTAALASASWFLVERPALGLKRRFARRFVSSAR